jgi:hypothetical protein
MRRVAMRARLTLAVAAVSALGLVLSACSLAGPNPRTFTTAAEQKPAKPDATAIEQASQACKSELREKGIKSVLAILSSMRPGAVDQNYVKCMARKGYTVEK